MKKPILYIIQWYEDEDGNHTAKTVWEGKTEKEGREVLNNIELDRSKPLAELFINYPDIADARIDYRVIG